MSSRVTAPSAAALARSDVLRSGGATHRGRSMAMRDDWVDEAAMFFTELEVSNDRSWWSLHRGRYDAAKERFLVLLDGLEGWGTWRVYRPNNDVRFGNSAPYKTFLGAVAERPDGVGAFVQVSAKGLLVGSGVPQPAPDQLEAMRAGIAGAASGPALEEAITEVRATGAKVHGGRYEPLKRMPRGYPADHPRGELLRWKGIEVDLRPELVADVAPALEVGAPLHRWIASNVGPSALTPEERFAPKRRAR